MAIALVMQVALAATGGVSCEEGGAKQFQAAPARTGKERLGDKASDEQRMDNCKVPLELRGPKPRPDGCGDELGTRSKR